MSIARAWLYVPGDRPDLMAKARRHLRVTLILDLEDAVDAARKDYAQNAVAEFCKQGPHPGGMWVRVNAALAGLENLRHLAEVDNIDGIWIPKAEDAAHLMQARDLIPKDRRMGLLIESSLGLAQLQELAALPGVDILQLGEIDLASSLSQRGHTPLLEMARAWAVLYSSANDLLPPAGPVNAVFSETAHFENECVLLRDIGFGSRCCIHPSQLEPAIRAFTSSPDEVSAARQTVLDFERASAEGTGAWGSGGVMVDAATVRWARQVLARDEEDRAPDRIPYG